MRNFGFVVMVLGIAGFFYCSAKLSEAGTVPQGESIGTTVQTSAGRWEIGRYACAGAGAFGFLMMMFPKGR
jgi:hypothetical protein